MMSSSTRSGRAYSACSYSSQTVRCRAPSYPSLPSCPVLCLAYLILVPCPALPCPALPYPTLPRSALPYPALSCPTFSCPFLPSLPYPAAANYPDVSLPALAASEWYALYFISFLVLGQLPCPALPCCALGRCLPCPVALPCPAIPYPCPCPALLLSLVHTAGYFLFANLMLAVIFEKYTERVQEVRVWGRMRGKRWR